MQNLRAETLAVVECQKGNVFPLFAILTERLQSARFAMTICMSLKRGKPSKITKQARIGVHVDALRRKHPGWSKKEIVYAVAEQFGVKPRTAENYYAHWLKITKPVRHVLDPILEADQ